MEYTEQEKQAIERLKYVDMSYDYNNYYSKYDLDCIETLLNLLKKQQKEIEEMARFITDITDCPLENLGVDLNCEEECSCDVERTKNCWKKYFSKKIEKSEGN